MGRPREFDVDQALDAALSVFWSKGYEGASYTDLTKATGVERPALYSAFGNKEALFRLALARYYERYLNFFPQALAQPSSRKVVEHIFRGAAELHTRFPDRRGCMGIHGALVGSDDVASIQLSLIEARAHGEAALRARLERAQQEGDLPASADCAALAGFVMAITHGMAVQAKAGFSRERLDDVGSVALSAWPS